MVESVRPSSISVGGGRTGGGVGGRVSTGTCDNDEVESRLGRGAAMGGDCSVSSWMDWELEGVFGEGRWLRRATKLVKNPDSLLEAGRAGPCKIVSVNSGRPQQETSGNTHQWWTVAGDSEVLVG